MMNAPKLRRGAMRDSLFIVCATVMVGWGIVTFLQSMRLNVWDFQAFWGAGRALNAGIDPYSQSAMSSQLGVQVPFFSPIFLAEALRPIGLLSYMEARTLWMALSLVGVAVLSMLLVSLSHVRLGVRSWLVAFAVLAAFEPFAGGDMYLGQTDLFVVLAVALSWYFLERKWRFLAGLVFCVGAANPHLVLGIGLYYLYRSLRRREYALLLGMVIGGAGLIGASLLYPQEVIEWLTSVLPSVQQNGMASPMMLTPLHLFYVLLTYVPAAATHAIRGAEALDGITILVMAVIAVRFWERDRGRSLAVEMAVATVLGTVASTFAFHQDLLALILLAPSIVELATQRARWVAAESASERALWIDRVSFLAVCASTILFSAMTGYVNFGVNEFRLPFYFAAPALALILVVLNFRPSEALLHRMLPWAVAFLLLSAVGSYLPLLAGMSVIQVETVIIFLGLLIYLRGLWLWRPALYQPASVNAPAASDILITSSAPYALSAHLTSPTVALDDTQPRIQPPANVARYESGVNHMERQEDRKHSPGAGALVIGASSGMGAALARRLIREGYRVALVARRAESLHALCDELNGVAAEGPTSVGAARAYAYPHDVRDVDAAPALFARIVRDIAPLRLVIYAAGTMPPARTGAPADFTAEREILDTNALGAMRWLGLAADALQHQGEGMIIAISSVAGDRGRPGNGAYMASKAALTSYLNSLRYRLNGSGVRVLTIKPGYVKTPMTAGLRLPKPLTVTADVAAKRILREGRKRRRGGIVYVPGRWAPLMMVIRHLPDRIIARMKDPGAEEAMRSSELKVSTEVIEGYGMRQRAYCQVAHARSAEDIAAIFEFAAREGLTVGLRGSGCSYGDAALNTQQVVIDCSTMNRILAWDSNTGIITVQPGATIEDLWRHCLGDGWWPPVVPGTMAVSVGGATAANIHGKNQWLHGSFGEHVLRFELLLPSGETVTCAPTQNPDLFYAAIGGWGLLGAFTSITLQLRRVHSGLVHVRQTAHRNLEDLLMAVDAGTADSTHLVGWIDTAARGNALGRGLLKSMRELRRGEDRHPERTLDPDTQPPSGRIMGVIPAKWIPVLGKPIASPLGIRLANHGQWLRGNLPGAHRAHLERYVPANFMLNFIPNFKRIYRPGGLIQHQTFAPHDAAPELFKAILRRSQESGLEPALAVLKKHKPSPFLLNYLPDGYSLALDYAVPKGREAQTLALMDELNAMVANQGGRFFLAKDSTVKPEQFAATFAPEALVQFYALKLRVDPREMLQTDIYRRVVQPAIRAAAQATPFAR